MSKKVICIAGKNQVAVNAINYTKKIYSDEFIIVGLPNDDDYGIDNWQPSFKKHLEQLHVETVTLEKLYEIENLVFLSLEYDKIIKPSKFKTKALFNIHFSFLPKYKGMYTSALPILNNEKYSGVTLHYIDEGIDTGEIISQTKFVIDNQDDSFDLYAKYNRYAFCVFKNKIQSLLDNKFESNPQSIRNSTYFSKKSIDYSNLKINYNQTAQVIRNQIRAFAFRPYQLPKFNETKIRFSKITNNRSIYKPKNIINEDFFSYVIATIDYNIILYKDCLETMLNFIRNYENIKVKQYINLNYPLNDKNKNGWDMLIVATYFGNKEIFELLIKNGANIKTTNYKKTNLLMYSLTPFEEKNDKYFFDKLIKLGLDVKSRDGEGNSTLDWIEKRKLKID